MKKIILLVTIFVVSSCASQRYVQVNKDGSQVQFTPEARSIASHPIQYSINNTTYYFESEKDKQKFIDAHENSEQEYIKNRMMYERNRF